MTTICGVGFSRRRSRIEAVKRYCIIGAGACGLPVAKTFAERGIPFVARGAAMNLSGGSAPTRGGVVIALTRMKRVLEVDGKTVKNVSGY